MDAIAEKICDLDRSQNLVIQSILTRLILYSVNNSFVRYHLQDNSLISVLPGEIFLSGFIFVISTNKIHIETSM